MARQAGRQPEETDVERGPVAPERPPRTDEERDIDRDADEEE